MHQYRLRGPYEDRPMAEAVYRRQPVGDVLEGVITSIFVCVGWLLSRIGWRACTLNFGAARDRYGYEVSR